MTTTIDTDQHLSRDFTGVKATAMTAHATQITVDGDYYALSDNVGRRISGVEHYIQLAGPSGPVPARDLFDF